MKQKFPRGSRVKVDDEMPSMMSHFECGFEAIIQYSDLEEYGYKPNPVIDYSLMQLDGSGKGINLIAWYGEDQLTLVDDNIAKGLQLLEDYKYNNPEEDEEE